MERTVTGTFELSGRSGGHLRLAEKNYAIRRDDAVVTAEVASALRLRGGETVEANCAPGKGNRPPGVKAAGDVVSVNGLPPQDHLELVPFEDLTAIDPRERVKFETAGGPTTMRIVDLLTPIGLGQRGLIVAAPRTGKTILLQQMAAGVAANHPDVYMMVLLIDERPEEVTDMRRTVHGEVVASSSDNDIASHVRLARLMAERARRLVESGRDVFILLDSLTRLGRAFNSNLQGSRRIMSGGLDARALTEPKSIFGAARNVEGGGSLTIVASCLIETGSRMDDVIFNEFKGTGNMEIMLCRELADRRIWPAIDLQQSGTRKEELLLSTGALDASHVIRRDMLDRGIQRGMTSLLEAIEKTSNNDEFIKKVNSNRR